MLVRAGSCSLPLTAPAGNLAITEAPAEGTRVTDITVAGAGSLVTRDLTPDGHGQPCLRFHHRGGVHQHQAVHPGARLRLDREVLQAPRPVIAKLVPGAPHRRQRQAVGQAAHWALKAGQRRNFRFKLQSELIAALLNQLGGASTPAKVQAAIDGAQLLLSHSDGALHKGKWNTLETGSNDTVRWKGRTSKAVQLRDVLRDYNQGKLHGCPDTCAKGKSGNDKPGHGKPGHGKSMRNWRAI